VKNTIDCTSEVIKKKSEGLHPLVAFLLAGANGAMNWLDLLISLESLGVDVVACTAQGVQDDLALKVAALPADDRLGAGPEKMILKLKAKAVGSNFEAYKKARLEGITLKTTPAPAASPTSQAPPTPAPAQE